MNCARFLFQKVFLLNRQQKPSQQSWIIREGVSFPRSYKVEDYSITQLEND